jgi:hypothetical protein
MARAFVSVPDAVSSSLPSFLPSTLPSLPSLAFINPSMNRRSRAARRACITVRRAAQVFFGSKLVGIGARCEFF